MTSFVIRNIDPNTKQKTEFMEFNHVGALPIQFPVQLSICLEEALGLVYEVR